MCFGLQFSLLFPPCGPHFNCKQTWPTRPSAALAAAAVSWRSAFVYNQDQGNIIYTFYNLTHLFSNYIQNIYRCFGAIIINYYC